jgi:hypothetical protein
MPVLKSVWQFANTRRLTHETLVLRQNKARHVGPTIVAKIDSRRTSKNIQILNSGHTSNFFMLEQRIYLPDAFINITGQKPIYWLSNRCQ